MSKYTDLREVLAHTTATFQSRIDRQPEIARPQWRRVLRSMSSVLRRWRQNREARRALLQMDARSLRELGIAPELADYEASRPFWQTLRDLRS